jgi:K+-sensing histidine kinase KdpD
MTWVVGIGGVGAVTAVCLALGDHVDNTIVALVLLLPIGAASMLGGWRRSIVVSFVAALTYALAFLPPIGHVRIGVTRDVFVLLTFEAVAILVGVLAARREPGSSSDVVLRAVSHDLRNPLSTIRAASSDLLTGVHTDEAHRAELLGLVVSESARLDRIVGNLLSVGRVRAGALVPATTLVDLDQLLVESVSRLQRPGDAPIVVDAAAGLPLVQVDRVQLDLVLANLVENAQRHGRPGAPIIVAARHDPSASVVEITIVDHGPGFTAVARRDAFLPFHSANGSSGIGLSVCKAVVEAHGGTIELLANANPGSTVRVVLPMPPTRPR